MSDQGANPRTLADAWISADLLAEGIAVWSRLYRRPIGTEEAIEMLQNVKRAGEVIDRIVRAQALP